MYVISTKFESSFLSLILEDNLCMALDADGSALPVHKKRTEKNFLDFEYLLLVFQLLDGFGIFLGILLATWAIFCMRKKHFHFNKHSAEK